MLFYPSRTRDRLNGNKPIYFERLTGQAMLNPLYPIRSFSPSAHAVCDSGAFQDLGKRDRLSPAAALDRQLQYEERMRWHMDDHSFHFESVMIYDQMAGVDEAIVNGRKRKIRGNEHTAERAIHDTLESAAYYASRRGSIAGAIGFVGQGVSADQYVDQCVIPMAELMRPGDWFAFGGMCIMGMRRSLLPVFYETFPRVLQALIPKGIRRFHLLGVCVPEAVTYAARIAAGAFVYLSTDSSAPELASVISGAVYVNGRKKQGPWEKSQKGIDYCPTDLAHANIHAYATWAWDLGANPPDAAPIGAL